jgi:UDP-N-acetylglucosamine transferase subunit ALG13
VTLVEVGTEGGRPVIFATVGTDHHPFDRMVHWVDRWLDANAERGVTGFIQTGTSVRPQRARSADYLGYEQMQAVMRRAIAVVSHGGPGSIMLCSHLGKKSIVVPRRASLGEHVDDHQVLFSRRLAAEGQIELAETEDRLGELLERALLTGATVASPGERDRVARTAKRFDRLVDELLTERRLDAHDA